MTDNRWTADVRLGRRGHVVALLRGIARRRTSGPERIGRGRAHLTWEGRGQRPACLADVLEVLARLEPDGTPGRDSHFLARPWVTADATLAWLDLEDAEAPKLDAIAALHRQAHGVEYGIDRHLSLDLGDVGDF